MKLASKNDQNVLLKKVNHIFSDIQEKYRALFYEIIDVILVSLDRRFQKNFIEHLSLFECFIIGKDTSHKDIIIFYGPNFNGDKLQLHKVMLLEIAKSRNLPIKNIEDILKLLQNEMHFVKCYRS